MKYRSMWRFSNFSKLIGFAVLPLLAAFFLSAGVAHASNYNGSSYLLDDNVMRATGTLNSGDIQAFLENEGSGLATFHDVENCGSPSGAHYSYYATYYSCGQSESASTIIYDAAQAYGINPEVILATLQKEQSLITTPNPTSSQLNFAMGYGCPDSGGCSYPGFFNQVDNGTWQFRTDMELGSGNNWWGYSPSAYPCNGPTRYYSAALVSGSNVTFYDDHGTAYANFVMPNMSTATLYCYTPHVYPGSSQEYYSGSYWFDHYFQLWWPSYTWNGTFYSLQDKTGSKSVDPGQLQPGQEYLVTLQAHNTGSATWTNNGPNPVNLGTTDPQGHNSFLCDSGWLSCNRPTTLVEASVGPGQTGHFKFLIKVPFSVGSYREFFTPVAEELAWFNDGTDSLGFSVVSPGTYSWQNNHYSVTDLSSNSVDPGNLQPGQIYQATLTAKNTGTATWTNSGPTPVDLGTDNPQGRSSILCLSSWLTCARPTTLVESSVSPGQTGHFVFNFRAPYQPGSYREYFTPVAEEYSWFNNSSEPLGIIVYSLGTFSWNNTFYSIQDKTGSTSVDPGHLQPNTQYLVTLSAHNNGTATWTNSGPTPVNLGTTNPIGHSSFLCDSTSWLTCARPTTLVESSVSSGQTGHFKFLIDAPSSAGSYREYFKPVAEEYTWFNEGTDSLGVVVQ